MVSSMRFAWIAALAIVVGGGARRSYAEAG
jgi:hypothetical protein